MKNICSLRSSTESTETINITCTFVGHASSQLMMLKPNVKVNTYKVEEETVDAAVKYHFRYLPAGHRSPIAFKMYFTSTPIIDLQ